MVFYLIFFKRILDKSIRVILFLLIINFISDLYGLYSIVNRLANFTSFNIFILIETISIYLFFSKISTNSFIKKTILILLSIFIIFWCYQFLKYGHKVFLLNCAILEYTTVLILVINYYFEQIIKGNSIYVYSKPRFWIVSAYFVYISGTFFLILYIPTLRYEEQLKYYMLNYVFVIIRTILLSIAMFMKDNNSIKQNFTLT